MRQGMYEPPILTTVGNYNVDTKGAPIGARPEGIFTDYPQY
jgi:hypothetical protein